MAPRPCDDPDARGQRHRRKTGSAPRRGCRSVIDDHQRQEAIEIGGDRGGPDREPKVGATSRSANFSA